VIGELVRLRTEWSAPRAIRESRNVVEPRCRLRDSRERFNAALDEISLAARSVDRTTVSEAGLAWLRDLDDRPVMQAALAAGAGILVTDYSRDFPFGERRNGVQLLGPAPFLDSVYRQSPDARTTIAAYVRRRTQRRQP
jgi:hypothetical protein